MNKKAVSIILLFSGMLFIIGCTPGKTEVRSEIIKEWEYYNVYLINTTTKIKYEFIVKEFEVSKYYDENNYNKKTKREAKGTSTYTLKPGEEKYIGGWRWDRRYKWMVEEGIYVVSSKEYKIVGYLEVD